MRRLLLLLLLPLPLAAQPARVGIVDVYGTRTASASAIRAALGVRPGDALPFDTAAALRRLRLLPNVDDAHVAVVCCANDGRSIVYAGVVGHDTPRLETDAPPTGTARLPAGILEANARVEEALQAAVRRGRGEETADSGFSLMRDSLARRAQLRFRAIAERERALLRAARSSADARHRMIAARILAYQDDRLRAFEDLLPLVRDPDEEVRNEAMRALALLHGWATKRPAMRAQVASSAGLFALPLTSVAWSDRNKASLALLRLTDGDSTLHRALRARDKMDALVDMARWQTEGHAMPALVLLGRIAGLGDEETFRLVQGGEREKVIEAARRVQGPATPVVRRP